MNKEILKQIGYEIAAKAFIILFFAALFANAIFE